MAWVEKIPFENGEEVEIRRAMNDTGLAPDAIVSVRNLSKHFPSRKKVAGQKSGIRVLDNINFDIRAGETLGLVGESGSGKTTLGRCIIGIFGPDVGEILYRRRDGRVVDMTKLDRREQQHCQREIRMVFQDPFSSLNPRLLELAPRRLAMTMLRGS